MNESGKRTYIHEKLHAKGDASQHRFPSHETSKSWTPKNPEKAALFRGFWPSYGAKAVPGVAKVKSVGKRKEKLS